MIEPLTPPDCDLRDFAFMPLDVARLRDSDLAREETPEACWAAVQLWGAAWHQVPAGSLPDNERVLANLAGYGRVVAAWQPIREGALRNFVKCSDGRLYHPVVAAKAREAWKSKLEQRWRSECGRIKKSNQRHERNDPVPSLEEFLAARVLVVSPGTSPSCPEGQSPMSPETGDTCPQGQGEFQPPVSLPCPSGNGVQERGTGTGTGTGTGRPKKEAYASSAGSDEPNTTGDAPKSEADLLMDQLVASVAKPGQKPKPKWAGDEAFVEAWAECTNDMRTRSDSREKTWPVWIAAAVKAGGPDRLRSALKAYLAGDKDILRGTGGPGFHIWLKSGKWEHWLPKEDAGRDAKAPAWSGPAALRAAIVDVKGDGWAVSYIDSAGWRDLPTPTLTPRTTFGAGVIEREVGQILRHFGVSIERAAA